MKGPMNNARAEMTGIFLGYFGLVPFIAGAVASLLLIDFNNFIINAFQTYSLAILSFMGGVHWGLALVEGPSLSTRLCLSVIPVIVGWFCVIVMPKDLALAVLGGAFIVQWLIDRSILASVSVPAWYLDMRPRLAYAVAGCHLFVVFRLISN